MTVRAMAPAGRNRANVGVSVAWVEKHGVLRLGRVAMAAAVVTLCSACPGSIGDCFPGTVTVGLRVYLRSAQTGEALCAGLVEIHWPGGVVWTLKSHSGGFQGQACSFRGAWATIDRPNQPADDDGKATAMTTIWAKGVDGFADAATQMPAELLSAPLDRCELRHIPSDANEVILLIPLDGK